ncbi:MAG: hypothetical protein BWX54_02241 [Verrucomicrobia bacterium ADurb.Bin018]|nr:MAG: hypothetical protein BWX54_02241 [Verrucomicrobia bacterium ADurb.Bin018]
MRDIFLLARLPRERHAAHLLTFRRHVLRRGGWGAGDDFDRLAEFANGAHAIDGAHPVQVRRGIAERRGGGAPLVVGRGFNGAHQGKDFIAGRGPLDLVGRDAFAAGGGPLQLNRAGGGGKRLELRGRFRRWCSHAFQHAAGLAFLAIGSDRGEAIIICAGILQRGARGAAVHVCAAGSGQRGQNRKRAGGAFRPLHAVLNGTVGGGSPLQAHLAQAKIGNGHRVRRLRRLEGGRGWRHGIAMHADQIIRAVASAAGVVIFFPHLTLHAPILDDRSHHFVNHGPRVAGQGPRGIIAAAGVADAPHHAAGITINEPQRNADHRIAAAAVGDHAVFIHRANHDAVRAHHFADFHGRGFRQAGQGQFCFAQHLAHLSALDQRVAAGAHHFGDDDIGHGGADQLGRRLKRQDGNFVDRGGHGSHIDVGIRPRAAEVGFRPCAPGAGNQQDARQGAPAQPPPIFSHAE